MRYHRPPEPPNTSASCILLAIVVRNTANTLNMESHHQHQTKPQTYHRLSLQPRWMTTPSRQCVTSAGTHHHISPPSILSESSAENTTVVEADPTTTQNGGIPPHLLLPTAPGRSYLTAAEHSVRPQRRGRWWMREDHGSSNHDEDDGTRRSPPVLLGDTVAELLKTPRHEDDSSASPLHGDVDPEFLRCPLARKCTLFFADAMKDELMIPLFE